MELDLLDYIHNYGTYLVKVKCFCDRFDPSYDINLIYEITGARLKIYRNRYLKIVKNLYGTFTFELLIDNEVVDTFEYDGDEDFQIDLDEYEIEDGKRQVNIRAVGEGLNENISNSLFYYRGGAPVYGVSGLTESTPTLTRTDDAEGLTFSVDNTTGEIESDFNDVFPWCDAELVENEAGKFLKMPDMYFRIGTDESHRITDIAVSAEPRTGDGNWYFMPSFLYGCYGASIQNNKLYSVSGVTRAAGHARATYRTYAANQGEGFHQLDLYHYVPMVFLFWIEFATRKCETIMTGRYSGSGTSGGSSIVACGLTDGLRTPSGFELAYKQMRYHYIEDFYGNVHEFLDGIISQGYGGRDYVTSDPTKFSDSITSDYRQVSYANPPANYSYPVIRYIGWDEDNPFMVLPTETINDSTWNTYFCKRSVSYGNPTVFVGATYANGIPNFGLYALGRCSNGSGYSDCGSRVVKNLN